MRACATQKGLTTAIRWLAYARLLFKTTGAFIQDFFHKVNAGWGKVHHRHYPVPDNGRFTVSATMVSHINNLAYAMVIYEAGRRA